MRERKIEEVWYMKVLEKVTREKKNYLQNTKRNQERNGESEKNMPRRFECESECEEIYRYE